MRSRTGRIGSIASATLLLALAFGLRVADASCAAPWIETEGWLEPPVEIQPGQTLEVIGEAWTEDCNDTGVVTTGVCSRSQAAPPPQRPMTDITITVRRPAGPLSWVVAEGIDAGPDLRFRVSITLPDELAPGLYVLEASSSWYTTYDPIDLVVR